MQIKKLVYFSIGMFLIVILAAATVSTTFDSVTVRNYIKIGSNSLYGIGTDSGMTLSTASDTMAYSQLAALKELKSERQKVLYTIQNVNDYLSLINDSASPGNSMTYGTTSAGVKGYENVITKINASTGTQINGSRVSLGNISHSTLSDTGVQLHTAIDAHLSATGNTHAATSAQIGADTAGTAASVVGSHESTYNHAHYNTAYTKVNTDSGNWDTAYTHSQLVTGNPHAVTASQAGAAAIVHTHSADSVTSGAFDGDRLPAMSTTKKGGVPATGTPSDKYLRDDGTWQDIVVNNVTNGTDTGNLAYWSSATSSYIPLGNDVSGKFLKSNGASAAPSWETVSGTGTVTSITATAPLTGGTITISGSIGMDSANASQDGYLTKEDWATFNGKGSSNLALGVTPTTAYAGDSGAAAYAAAVTNATNNNTASTIVKRDGSGNFSAGTITANLNGNASGTAANVTGTVSVANGGTGGTSQSSARSNLGLGALAVLSTLPMNLITDSEAGFTPATHTQALANGGTGATTAAAAIVAIGGKAANGFVDRTNSTLGMSGSNFQVTTTGSYDIYTAGTKYTKSTTQEVAISTDKTLHFVYFNSSGILTVSTLASDWSITSDNVLVATVYKDGATYCIADERHGWKRDRDWHKWAHETIGAMWHTGLNPTFADATLGVTSGEIDDEDIHFTITSNLDSPRIWYRNSTTTMRVTSNAAKQPYLSVSGTDIAYDASGTPTQVDNNKYVCTYLFATNDKDYALYIVAGQSQHATIAAARSEALPTIQLATAEWKLLARAIYKSNGASAPTYQEAADYRNVSRGPAILATATDHQSLINREVAGAHPQAAISGLTTADTPSFASVNLTGSQTAKYFLASPNADAGAPSFRAIVASDIPTLNQNTSGSAASLSSALAADKLPTGGAWSLSSDLNINSNTFVIDQSASTVGIGTSTPGAELDMAGGAILFSATRTTELSSSQVGLMRHNSGAMLLYYGTDDLVFKSGGSDKMRISSAGVVTIGNLGGSGSRCVVSDANGILSAPASDRRLKTNIKSISEEMDVLGSLKRLRGVKFDWINKDKYGVRRDIGMIAQEVEIVLPELVSDNQDGMKSLEYSKMVAYLLEVAKEQQTQIDDLKSEISKLKGVK